MDLFFLYLLRLEIILILAFPIIYGLWGWRHGINERRTVVYVGALLAVLMFTYALSLGNPGTVSEISLKDWLFAGGLSLAILGGAFTFSQLF
jgi:hypothetical protein